MAWKKITAVDICEVTGYNRDQLRGLLQKLPIYAGHSGSPRVAREFIRHDVIVLSVAVRLEQKHGLQRVAVAAVIDPIYAELRGPRPANPSPFLHISLDPPSATYLVERLIEDEGIVVALGPVFRQVDAYFSSDSSDSETQPSLPFGLSIASRGRRE